MTLRHMRIFAEVYRTRNVTHAAQNLHMTQPAVTRAIQELEQHYSIQEVIKLGVEGAEMRKQRNLCSEKVWYILE